MWGGAQFSKFLCRLYEQKGLRTIIWEQLVSLESEASGGKTLVNPGSRLIVLKFKNSFHCFKVQRPWSSCLVTSEGRAIWWWLIHWFLPGFTLPKPLRAFGWNCIIFIHVHKRGATMQVLRRDDFFLITFYHCQ